MKSAKDSSKKLIAVDIDDTIADSTDALRMRINSQLGLSLLAEDYRVKGEYWGYYDRVWKSHGIDHLLSYKDLNREMELDQSHVPLLPGAEYALGQLLKKYKLVYVTSREPSWEEATRRWFDNHLSLDVELYFAKHHRDGTSETKGQICKRLGAEVLIDDNYEHCLSAVEEGVKAVLYGDYGWHPSEKSGVVHCLDWQSVLEYFDV